MILTKTNLKTALKTLEETETAEDILKALEKIGQNLNCHNSNTQETQMTYS